MNIPNSSLRINGATLKMVVVGILILVCTIPSLFVLGLISDRQMYKEQAFMDITSKWGQPQTVAGPTVLLPYLVESRDEKNQVIRTPSNLAIVAKTMDVRTELVTQMKRRGIFQVPVYTATVTMNGVFELPPVIQAGADLSKAAVTVMLTDPAGVEVSPKLTWDGEEVLLEPGGEISGRYDLNGAMRAFVALPATLRSQAITVPFTYAVTVRGTERFSILPTALQVSSQMTSDWKSPSFMGSMLPKEATLSSEGFQASWNVSSQFVLSRNWVDISQNSVLPSQPFGVELFDAVDLYSLTERAVKYAILFIMLTFMVFFLVETMNGVRVHPFQYILVGAGLGLFYLLLLSLAEHIGFFASYLVSAVAIIGLITWYCSEVLKQNRFALLVGGLLSVLYIYLFTLLQMEDFALLFGALMLFAILASVMFVTRKVDWYGGK